MVDLSGDPNDGLNWLPSDPNSLLDPNNPSYPEFFNASPAGGTTTIYAGGDVGSPGSFDPNAPANDADFDDNLLVDALDFLTWQRGVGKGTTKSEGDSNLDETVDEADLAVWEAHYPQAVADLNGDNIIDALDFLAWQRSLDGLNLQLWEALYSNESSQLALSAAVPEPGTMAGFLLLLTFVLPCRDRAP